MKCRAVGQQWMCNKTSVYSIRLLFLLTYLIFSSLQVNAKEYIIGVEAIHYYPLFDFDTNDTTRPSFTKAVLTDFFESHNYKFKLLPLPVKRFNRWYIEQNIDFKFPDNLRWRTNSQLNITYSDPVIELVAGSFVLKKNQYITADKVKRVVTMLGFHPTLWLGAIQSGKTVLLEEPTVLGVVKHLLYGNAEATNIDENVIRHHLNVLGENRKVVLNKQIHSERYFYHLSSIKHPEIIKEFNQYLKDNADKIEQLKKQYNIRTHFE